LATAISGCHQQQLACGDLQPLKAAIGSIDDLLQQRRLATATDK